MGLPRRAQGGPWGPTGWPQWLVKGGVTMLILIGIDIYCNTQSYINTTILSKYSVIMGGRGGSEKSQKRIMLFVNSL